MNIRSVLDRCDLIGLVDRIGPDRDGELLTDRMRTELLSFGEDRQQEQAEGGEESFHRETFRFEVRLEDREINSERGANCGK